MDADVANGPRIEDYHPGARTANHVTNLPNEGFEKRPSSATHGNISPPREGHPHDNFTSPRQDTNLAPAGFRFFPRVSHRVFKGGRPCEKRRSRSGRSSANLPSETKGLNFNYL